MNKQKGESEGEGRKTEALRGIIKKDSHQSVINTLKVLHRLINYPNKILKECDRNGKIEDCDTKRHTWFGKDRVSLQYLGQIRSQVPKTHSTVLPRPCVLA